MSSLPDARWWDLNDLTGPRELAALFEVPVYEIHNWHRRKAGFPEQLVTVSGRMLFSRVQVTVWHERMWPGDQRRQVTS